MAMRLPSLLRRLRRDESGAALVELAISLPLMLIIFATAVEGARLMWSFEAANTGVRDASRYLARSMPLDICSTGIPDLEQLKTDTAERINRQMRDSRWFPSKIPDVTVEITRDCNHVGSYRVSPPPLLEVSARVEVQFPFSSVFSLAGVSLGNVVATVSDKNRVFGR